MSKGFRIELPGGWHFRKHKGKRGDTYVLHSPAGGATYLAVSEELATQFANAMHTPGEPADSTLMLAETICGKLDVDSLDGPELIAPLIEEFVRQRIRADREGRQPPLAV